MKCERYFGIGMIFVGMILGCLDGGYADEPKRHFTRSPGNNVGQATLTVANVQVVTKPDSQSVVAKKLQTAMQTKVTVELKDIALKGLIARLVKMAEVNIVIDETALGEEGIAMDEPISGTFRDVTIEQLFGRVLRPLGLIWLSKNEVVMVTTTIVEADLLFARVFDIQRLLQLAENEGVIRDIRLRQKKKTRKKLVGGGFFSVKALPQQVKQVDSKPNGMILFQGAGGVGGAGIGGGGVGVQGGFGKNVATPSEAIGDTIMNAVDAPWLEIEGSGGTLSVTGNMLVVRQTFHALIEIQQLLKALESVAFGTAESKTVAVRRPNYPFDTDEEITQELTRKFSVDYKHAALKDVLHDIQVQLNNPVWLDVTALGEEGIAEDEPISLQVNDVSTSSILPLFLEPNGLTHYVHDGALIVTTTIAAEEALNTSVYDVHDFTRAGVDNQELMDTLQQETKGPWQEVEGTGGLVTGALDGVLVIYQTDQVHLEIASLLRRMRTELRPTLAAQKLADKGNPDDIVRRIYSSLNVSGFATDTAVESKTSAEVIEAVKQLIAPQSWSSKGGKGIILKVGNMIVVQNTRKIQQDVQKFMTELESTVSSFDPSHDVHSFGGGGTDGGFQAKSPKKADPKKTKK